MALSQSQLLRRKQKKNKARTEKAKTVGQMSQVVSNWPVIQAYAPFYSRKEHTMQYVFIVRERPNGSWAIGMFLIDMLCLGVKDCFVRVIDPCYFDKFLEKMETILPMDEVPPGYVATLVHEAVEYAKNLGFNPRGDYRMVRKFLEGIPLDPSLAFTFGKDGKPFYIAGPHDSSKFMGNVLETLERVVGKDNYNFVLPIKETDDEGEIDDDEQIEHLPGSSLHHALVCKRG